MFDSYAYLFRFINLEKYFTYAALLTAHLETFQRMCKQGGYIPFVYMEIMLLSLEVIYVQT